MSLCIKCIFSLKLVLPNCSTVTCQWEQFLIFKVLGASLMQQVFHLNQTDMK